MLSQIQTNPDLFGLPLPSNDPGFIAVIGVHILLSFCAVMFGLVAMLKDKNSSGHSKFGKLYYWSIISSFVTVIILAAMRWPHNIHLLLIGLLTTIFVLTGRRLGRRKATDWARFHTICMGSSYILLLTGFYVDNGKNLPFWNQFSQWFFWIFPAIIGVPVILYVLRKHPLNKIRN